MKTALDMRIDRAIFGMVMGLGALLVDLGFGYAACWNARFDQKAVIVWTLYTLILLGVVLFNVIRYTEFRLNRFYNTPMCPIQDMVWDVKDLVIEPTEESDEPD